MVDIVVYLMFVFGATEDSEEIREGLKEKVAETISKLSPSALKEILKVKIEDESIQKV